MLSVSPAVKIFLYGQAADLRRGYDGLAAIVQGAMGEDPLSGSLFVFVNKRGNRIKLCIGTETGMRFG
jgi:transposase